MSGSRQIAFLTDSADRVVRGVRRHREVVAVCFVGDAVSVVWCYVPIGGEAAGEASGEYIGRPDYRSLLWNRTETGPLRAGLPLPLVIHHSAVLS